jgi:hypothetical protein
MKILCASQSMIISFVAGKCISSIEHYWRGPSHYKGWTWSPSFLCALELPGSQPCLNIQSSKMAFSPRHIISSYLLRILLLTSKFYCGYHVLSLKMCRDCLEKRKKCQNEAWVSFKMVECLKSVNFFMSVTGSRQEINCSILVHLYLSLCVCLKYRLINTLYTYISGLNDCSRADSFEHVMS